MNPPLTKSVSDVIATAFSPEDAALVAADILLVTNMTASTATAEESEACRLAVLHISDGTLQGYDRAIKMYFLDPRDVLAAWQARNT